MGCGSWKRSWVHPNSCANKISQSSTGQEAVGTNDNAKHQFYWSPNGFEMSKWFLSIFIYFPLLRLLGYPSSFREVVFHGVSGKALPEMLVFHGIHHEHLPLSLQPLRKIHGRIRIHLHLCHVRHGACHAALETKKRLAGSHIAHKASLVWFQSILQVASN